MRSAVFLALFVAHVWLFSQLVTDEEADLLRRFSIRGALGFAFDSETYFEELMKGALK